MASKYRDVFERIKVSVTDLVAQGNHQATISRGILNEETTERCRALDQGLPGGARTDYSQIISRMARDRAKIGSPAMRGIQRSQSKGQTKSQENENNLRLGMWPGAMLEYGKPHGQMSNFVDSSFRDSLEDMDVLVTDWDLAMMEGTNSFNNEFLSL